MFNEDTETSSVDTGFRDHAAPLFSLEKYRWVHMKGQTERVTEIWFFATEISVTGMKIF